MLDCKRKTESVFTWALLLSFLAGAMLAFRYREYLGIHFNASTAVFIALLLIEAFNVSSLTGIFILPVVTVLVGMNTAAAINGLKVAFNSGRLMFADCVVIILLVPLNFLLCSIGMLHSHQIRAIVYTDKELYKQIIFSSYSIMFSTLILFALYVKNIINI